MLRLHLRESVNSEQSDFDPRILGRPSACPEKRGRAGLAQSHDVIQEVKEGSCVACFSS